VATAERPAGLSQGFPKREHVVGKRLMEQLFGSGSRSAVAYPLRVVYCQVDRQLTGVPVQVLISVPKKCFKHAVDRNRVKRQLREAYRHHKALLDGCVPEGYRLAVAFIWLTPNHQASQLIEKRVIALLKQIGETIANK
jgi:ribonuclease P protein component